MSVILLSDILMNWHSVTCHFVEFYSDDSHFFEYHAVEWHSVECYFVNCPYVDWHFVHFHSIE